MSGREWIRFGGLFLTAFQGVWSVIVFVLGAPTVSAFAPAVIALAVLSTFFSLYRFRNPGWRQTNFWQKHRVLQAFAGSDLGMSSFRTKGGEIFAASMQLVFGIFTIFIAILLFAEITM